MKIRKLKKEAKRIARFCKHDMGNFVTQARPNPLMGDKGYVFLSKCKKCGDSILVETRPTGVEIGGTAIGKCQARQSNQCAP